MLTGEFPPLAGGVGDYTAQLVAALRHRGLEVNVLTAALPGLSEGLDPPAHRAVRDWGIGSWPLVEAALRAAQAQVLHIQYQAGAYALHGAITALPWWLRRRRPRLRVVTTFHDLLVPYLFPKAGRLRALAVRALLAGSHAAIFVDAADLARAGTRLTQRWIPVGSNVPCAPGPDFDRATVRRSLGADANELLIGFFGFLTASKGAATLLQAIHQLVKQGERIKLVLIGAASGSSNPSDRADEAAVQRLAHELGLADRITTTGYLESAAVSEHLLSCDVVALPYLDGASFRRGSLLAALEHGVPIVTTTPAPGAGGTTPRSLRAGEHALLVPSGEPIALAEALTQLCRDPALRQQLGSGARRLATHFSWETIAGETIDTYTLVLRQVAFAPGRPGSTL